MSIKYKFYDNYYFTGLLAMLGAADCYFMKNAYNITLVKGASAQLVFGFEVSLSQTLIGTYTRTRISVFGVTLFMHHEDILT